MIFMYEPNTIITSFCIHLERKKNRKQYEKVLKYFFLLLFSCRQSGDKLIKNSWELLRYII